MPAGLGAYLNLKSPEHTAGEIITQCFLLPADLKVDFDVFQDIK
jgi:hypothetical protein